MLGFATDALDGRLARAAEPTRLGRSFDGIVDAAFATAVLRGARRRRLLGGVATIAEGARLVLGTTFTLATYFGRGEAPDREVLEAGRISAVLRAAGYVAAVGRRRRLATTLLAGASTAKAVALAAWTMPGRPRAAAPGPASPAPAYGRRAALRAGSRRPPVRGPH
jgi:phosphatidylglycerophosphate synthase